MRFPRSVRRFSDVSRLVREPRDVVLPRSVRSPRTVPRDDVSRAERPPRAVRSLPDVRVPRVVVRDEPVRCESRTLGARVVLVELRPVGVRVVAPPRVVVRAVPRPSAVRGVNVRDRIGRFDATGKVDLP